MVPLLRKVMFSFKGKACRIFSHVETSYDELTDISLGLAAFFGFPQEGEKELAIAALTPVLMNFLRSIACAC
jgi:hypothetical protein